LGHDPEDRGALEKGHEERAREVDPVEAAQESGRKFHEVITRGVGPEGVRALTPTAFGARGKGAECNWVVTVGSEPVPH
jgi:hypothetical protein